MSTHKAAGKARQHIRPEGKRLGVKRHTGKKVAAGEVLVRQKGTKVSAGRGVKIGRDHTLYAKTTGTVKFVTKLGKKVVSIVS